MAIHIKTSETIRKRPDGMWEICFEYHDPRFETFHAIASARPDGSLPDHELAYARTKALYAYRNAFELQLLTAPVPA